MNEYDFWLQIGSLAASLLTGFIGGHTVAGRATKRKKNSSAHGNRLSRQDSLPQGGTNEKPDSPAQEPLR